MILIIIGTYIYAYLLSGAWIPALRGLFSGKDMLPGEESEEVKGSLTVG